MDELLTVCRCYLFVARWHEASMAHEYRGAPPPPYPVKLHWHRLVAARRAMDGLVAKAVRKHPRHPLAPAAREMVAALAEVRSGPHDGGPESTRRRTRFEAAEDALEAACEGLDAAKAVA